MEIGPLVSSVEEDDVDEDAAVVAVEVVDVVDDIDVVAVEAFVEPTAGAAVAAACFNAVSSFS